MTTTTGIVRLSAPNGFGGAIVRMTAQPGATVPRGAIHQLLNIILQLRILVLLLVSTLLYVVKVKNYS
jgi:hypothetical protein